MFFTASHESVSVPLPAGVFRELLLHDQKFSVTRIHIAKGVVSAPHSHPHAQVVYLLAGKGIFDMADQKIALKAGDCVAIAPDAPHCFLPPEDELIFLEFFVPGREDIAKQHGLDNAYDERSRVL